MELEKIAKIAYEEMGLSRSHSFKEVGNKYNHGIRTAKIALQLRKIVLPDDDSMDDILTVAAWFHDVRNGKVKHKVHGDAGAEFCMENLKGLCSDRELEEICNIIRIHDKRSSDIERSPYVMIHQDADHLDHFGSYDTMMAALENIAHGRGIDSVVWWLLERRPGEAEIYHRELNYDISRKIFDEKLAFMVAYGQRLKAESEGTIIGLSDML